MTPDEYISTLTPQELKVMAIAEGHLGSSFDLIRSIGYEEHCKVEEQQKNKQQVVKKKPRKRKLIVRKS